MNARVCMALYVALGVSACGTSEPVVSTGATTSSLPLEQFPSTPKTEAARWLNQATMGPNPAEIAALAAQLDFEAWLAAQKTAAISLQLPYLQAQLPLVTIPGSADETFTVGLTQAQRLEAWWHNAVLGRDQLRQRVAFALSEIMVVSDQNNALKDAVEGLAYYYDVLNRNALGNFRDLLGEVTLTPAMGHYLSMFQNQKPDAAAGIRADENFAREVMQLFTVGLVELNLDATPRHDADGRTISVATQNDIADLARVFTGWSWAGGSDDASFFSAAPRWTESMQPYQSYHDTEAKTILGNTRIPAGMQARAELDLALDTLFQHPNVGPFIGRQLIQRLVTSNPSPAYVARVATAFNDNGAGARGDLYAVARAILLDPEARATPTGSFGKLREPLLRVSHLWRVFDARGQNDRYNYNDGVAERYLSQAPLRAASVFNFFRPEFSPAGLLSQAGLVAPELQITDDSSVVDLSNELRHLANVYRTGSGAAALDYGVNAVLLDYAPWESRAHTPEVLIDDLGLAFMSGQMPAAMRTALIEYIGAIPADQAYARIVEAVHLIITSPQCAVQR